MPLVEVKVLEDVFSSEQKRDLIERMTDVLVEIQGEFIRPVTVVTVEEVASGSFGFGGNALTTGDVAALKAAATAGAGRSAA